MFICEYLFFMRVILCTEVLGLLGVPDLMLPVYQNKQTKPKKDKTNELFVMFVFEYSAIETKH